MPEVEVLLLTVTEGHAELHEPHECIEGVLSEAEPEQVILFLVQHNLDLAAEVKVMRLRV